jgi:hypothetical protein
MGRQWSCRPQKHGGVAVKNCRQLCLGAPPLIACQQRQPATQQNLPQHSCWDADEPAACPLCLEQQQQPKAAPSEDPGATVAGLQTLVRQMMQQQAGLVQALQVGSLLGVPKAAAEGERHVH